MIDYAQLLNELKKQVKKLNSCEGVVFKTYKKDRQIKVVKLDDGFLITEDGFYKKTLLRQTYKELEKEVKAMAKREFPNSHRLHVMHTTYGDQNG